MGGATKIEWTRGADGSAGATWTPIRARNLKTGKVGWYCEHATTGCVNCYAEGINKRLGTGLPFKPGHRQDVEIFIDDKMLTAPLHWKRPRMIFVCSMTDLFGDFVTDEQIDKVFAVMALCPQHTFQVLTKRAARMRDYLTAALKGQRPIASAAIELRGSIIGGIQALSAWFDHDHDNPTPMANVWCGVSCERREEADERIPFLLQTPAAVRFISAEPLLGPIDLMTHAEPDGGIRNFLDGRRWEPGQDRQEPSLPHLDWVIAGGESGPKARPTDPEWVRSLRDQCQAADIAYFFKQWGQWHADALRFTTTDGKCPPPNMKIGKKAAGRLLDGREWNEMPRGSA